MTICRNCERVFRKTGDGDTLCTSCWISSRKGSKKKKCSAICKDGRRCPHKAILLGLCNLHYTKLKSKKKKKKNGNIIR